MLGCSVNAFKVIHMAASLLFVPREVSDSRTFEKPLEELSLKTETRVLQWCDCAESSVLSLLSFLEKMMLPQTF